MTTDLCKASSSGSVLWDCLANHPDTTRLFPEYTMKKLRERVFFTSGQFAEQQLGKGEIIAFRVKNDPLHVAGVLSLLYSGTRPLLLPHDAPDPEVKRVCSCVGATRSLEIKNKSFLSFRLVGERPQQNAATTGSGLLLCTSGSTGTPKIVEHSEDSLLKEGRRYQNGVGVTTTDNIVLPLPISHAYGLGWLLGGLVAGACNTLLPPNALSGITERLSQGASILVLTPTLARLLSQRTISNPQDYSGFRLAMVGAGPVDQAVEQAFKKKFGIDLARNYGSTETGTLFIGFPPLPERCIGKPLPGVRYTITRENGTACVPCETGMLHVTDLKENWCETGDLAYEDMLGRVTVIGRKSKSIRRGDRWVSSLEIESVLQNHPEVDDVHILIKKGSREGNDHIVAEVVPKQALTFPKEDLFKYARENLAPYKVPDTITIVSVLNRSSTGKAKAKPVYRLAGAQEVFSVSRAYKRTELLFSLYQSGVLAALDGKRDLDAIADMCGLNSEALGIVLELAEAIGFLTRDTNIPCGFDPTPFLDLEYAISGSWTTRNGIADVLKYGIKNRCFEKSAVTPAFKQQYNSAMHGGNASYRVLLGLRLAKPAKGCSILEVTVGPGNYIDALLKRDQTASGALLQLSGLSGEYPATLAASVASGRATIGLNPSGEKFDVCVVNNAIHGPAPGNNIEWLLSTVKPTGLILIDDIFLPENGHDAEIGLDWLTHGGTSFRAVSDLTKHILKRYGVTLTPLAIEGDPLHKFILFKKEEMNE